MNKLSAVAEPAPAGPPQQRQSVAAHAAAANMPSSPVASTGRVAQQALRKRDLESELLDRLLNGPQAAVLAQGPPAPAPPCASATRDCSVSTRRRRLRTVPITHSIYSCTGKCDYASLDATWGVLLP